MIREINKSLIEGNYGLALNKLDDWKDLTLISNMESTKSSNQDEYFNNYHEKVKMSQRIQFRILYHNNKIPQSSILEVIKDEPEDEVKAAFVKRINEKNK